MINLASLIAASFALLLPAAAEQQQEPQQPQQQQRELVPVTIGGEAGQSYQLEGSSISAGAQAVNNAAAEEQKQMPHFIGGPQFQAGDPNAEDRPPTRLKRAVYRAPAPGASTTGSGQTSGSGSSGSGSGSTSSGGSSNNKVVAQAFAFMANPPYNRDNGTHDWTGWCLGFTVTTLRAAGVAIGPMAQPAAKDAYYAMAHANRISNDIKEVPAGAPLFWIGCSQWGHAAIATGEWSADGTPIMVTTSSHGIREMSTKQFGCGLPTGWGKI